MLTNAAPRPEELAVAEAEIELALARLEEAEVDLESTFIRAPIDGIVLRILMRPGETIAADHNDRPIVSVADASRIMVRAEVDETDVARVRVGQRAHVTAAAYGDATFPGLVVRVGHVMGPKLTAGADPTEKVDTEILETLIALEPQDTSELVLGLRVDVTIYLVYNTNVLTLPLRAVYTREETAYVRVKGEGGWVEREVKTGFRDEFHVEVCKGLNEGDIVALR
jgi:multidrug efflux pump subunit AcrA (membrane-fusion protein)